MRSLLILIFLLSLACEDMAQSTTTKVAGLWTNPNDARAPEGALAVADNVVLSRPGVVEPRRGFSVQNAAGLSEAVNAWHVFDGYIVAHTGASTLRRSNDDGATWTACSGTYTPPDASTVVKFWEHAGSLLFLTAAGVYELDSATGTPRLTGVTRAQDGTASLHVTTDAGWMEPDTQVAYRVAWLYRNGNSKTQYGGASGRFLVSNPAAKAIAVGGLSKADGTSDVVATLVGHGFSVNDYVTITLGGAETYFAAGTFLVDGVPDTDSFTYSDLVDNDTGSTVESVNASAASQIANVSLTIPIPAEITTDYALQVFRSAQSVTASTEPTDALGLVYEVVPNNVDITAGEISFTDVTPDTLRGVDWQDVVTGGPTHDRPPVAKDAVVWRGVSFYANTERRHSVLLRILSVADWATIGGGSSSLATSLVVGEEALISADTAENGSSAFKLYTSGSTAQNIADTARSLVRTINANSSRTFRATYVSGETDAPGEILLERTTSDDPLRVALINAAGSNVSPSLVTLMLSASGQTSRTGSTVTVNTAVPHGFVVGQTVTLWSGGGANFVGGDKTITSVSDVDTFAYSEAGSAVASTSDLVFASQSGVTSFATVPIASAAEELPNSLTWSTPEEPWHVPLLNQAFVGHEGDTIKAIVPTRDKLTIWTDAGIYQLFGDYPNFAIAELDTTLRLAAYRTAVPVAGRVFGLTTTGVVEVQDSARVVSVPIEDSLRDLLANHFSNLALYSFAVPYESERLLLLWLVDDSSDAYAAQAFVYHLDSGQWTRWTAAATTGFVHPTQDRLYLGATTAGVVWKERKARAAADHQDGSAAISSVVEFAQLMPAGPGAAAMVDSGSLDFQEANFAAASMQFASNLSPTLSDAMSVAPPGGATTGAVELVFPVPQAQMRGTRYRVRFAHATAAERYQLQGLTLNFRATSKRPGR